MHALAYGQSGVFSVHGELKASPEDFQVREIHDGKAEDCDDYSLKRVELVCYFFNSLP